MRLFILKYAIQWFSFASLSTPRVTSWGYLFESFFLQNNLIKPYHTKKLDGHLSAACIFSWNKRRGTTYERLLREKIHVNFVKDQPGWEGSESFQWPAWFFGLCCYAIDMLRTAVKPCIVPDNPISPESVPTRIVAWVASFWRYFFPCGSRSGL